jgi:hypothetical protein
LQQRGNIYSKRRLLPFPTRPSENSNMQSN